MIEVLFFLLDARDATPSGEAFIFVTAGSREGLPRSVPCTLEPIVLGKAAAPPTLPIDLLVVEDELADVKNVLHAAASCPHIKRVGVCYRADVVERALEVLPAPKIVTLDFVLRRTGRGRAPRPKVTAELRELYARARRRWTDCVVIGLTAFGHDHREIGDDVLEVRQALNREGDVVYSKTDQLWSLLPEILSDAISRWSLRCERNAARERARPAATGSYTPATDPVFTKLFAPSTSTAFLNAVQVAHRVATSPFEAHVLLHGETGSGKELFARFVHAKSTRSAGPFVAVNCGGFVEQLVEDDLFGHRAGAFTGAHENRVGMIEKANGGTLFLDEIGEMSLRVQVKLLRVLQESVVVRLGETQERPVSFRLVAATHRDLKKMVSEEKFREDLYYRINVVEVSIPPLRERQEDIALLTDHFFRQFAGLPAERALTGAAIDALSRLSWPGNVRELQNRVKRILVEHPGGTALGPEVLALGPLPPDSLESAGELLTKIEQESVRKLVAVLAERGDAGVPTATLADELSCAHNKVASRVQQANRYLKRKGLGWRIADARDRHGYRLTRS